VGGMDTVDRQLISSLRTNARATYAELGRRVGLSPPAVHERVAKLESSGVITGYHAAVVGAFRGMSEIEDCWFVAGDESYLLKIRVADMAALEATINALSRIRGVSRTRTTVVLSTRWEARIAGDADELGVGVADPDDEG